MRTSTPSIAELRAATQPASIFERNSGEPWAGRLIAAWVLLVAGALPTGFFIAAAVFGVVFVAESAVSWLRSEPADELDVYDEEEDEEGAE